jgi:inorganic triphosphatase YgiF
MKFLVDKEEHELKFIPTLRLQVKLFAPLHRLDVAGVRATMQNVFDIANFNVAFENVKLILDEYYDSDGLALFKGHSLFRVRRDGGPPTIVVKMPEGGVLGDLKRREYELETTEEAYQKHIADNFSSLGLESLFGPANQKLALRLKVINERRNLLLQRHNENYRLSFDTFTYTNARNGRASQTQFEIEIEALNEQASQKLSAIKNSLIGILKGFEFSAGSKYERGIRVLHMDRSKWGQRFWEWTRGKGLGWASVIFGFLGIILAVIGIILTARAMR